MHTVLPLLPQPKELVLTCKRFGFGALLLTSAGEEAGHYLTPGITGITAILCGQKVQSLQTQGSEKATSCLLVIWLSYSRSVDCLRFCPSECQGPHQGCGAPDTAHMIVFKALFN